ncbi:MAG: hypothetical protein AB8B91_23900 [Rubripirellula sp.]
MSRPTTHFVFALTCFLLIPGFAFADEILFDLPPVAEVVPASAAADQQTQPNDELELVTVQLRLSSMIESPEVPRIDQWLVRCQPRDSALSIHDFAPRTETASDLATPIQVKNTEEQTKAIGLSLDGSYGHAARGNAGLDQASKNVNSVQFDRHAPVQAVSAAGTINRGRGVYFKLRWTAHQVLEGEKTFSITLRVPQHWRGGLMDVSVIAQSQHKSFGGWDKETKTLGAANFVVGLYRQGDSEAAAVAQSLANAEHQLRVTAEQHSRPPEPNSLPRMLRQVAIKLDLESSRPNTDWVRRLLTNQADPHLDKQIRKLPMPVRVAVLDYVDARDEFAMLHDGFNRQASDRVFAAKPAQ